MGDLNVIDRPGESETRAQPNRGPRWRLGRRLLRGRSPWVQAPLVLLSYPAIFVAVMAALVILSLAVVSGPIFRSAAGNAALEDQMKRVPAWLTGFTVSVPGPFSGPLRPELRYPAPTGEAVFQLRDRGLRAAVDKLHALGSPTLSIVADAREVRTEGAHPRSFVVRPIVRTDAFSHVSVIERVPGDGVWVTDVVARALELKAGDRLLVPRGEQLVPVTVVAVYHDLATGYSIPEFWQPLATWIRPINPDAPPFPPFLLMTEATFRSFAGHQEELPTFQWEFPLLRKRLTLEQGGVLAAELINLGIGLHQPDSPLAAPYVTPDDRTLFPSQYFQARDVGGTLEAPIQVLSLSAVLVALAVVAAVGVYWIQRRRIELRELGARGASATAVAGRSLLEALPAAAIGAVAGWLLATPLVRTLGPTDLISSAVRASALRSMLRTDVVAVVVLAIVVGVGTTLSARARSGRAADMLSRVPWEVVALALAAAALYEALARQTSVVTTPNGATKVDKLLLLFPLLFLVGGSALLVRGLRLGLARLRSMGSRWPTPLFIAFRRISNASGVAALLMAAVAVATGTLTYAASLQSSLETARLSKARTFLGSDHLIQLGTGNPQLPADLGPGATVVGRASTAFVPDYHQVEILEVDPATFAGGAFWDRRFADRSLPSLLASLGTLRGGAVPAVATSSAGGDLPSLIQVIAGPRNISVRITQTVYALPGSDSPPTILVDRQVLERALANARELASPREQASVAIGRNLEVWVRGSAGPVVARLVRANVPVSQESSSATIASSSAFLALSWTFGFMKGVGALIGLVAVVALLLYLQGRQRSREVSYSLARRMGLRSTVHGASLLLELAGLLVIALGIGAGLALVAARLTFTRLDPLPKLAPQIWMQVPTGALLLAAALLAAGALVGSILAQRRASRTNVAEVLRVAV